MSLSSKSNTINAVGIFGRLEESQEKYFQNLQGENLGFFNHLSLAINKKVPIGELPKYIDLLKDLKQFLPLNIKINDIIFVNERDIALSFNLKETEKIRKLTKKYFPEGIIETHYTKVVRNVSKNKQQEISDLISKNFKYMNITDFVLCANEENDKSIIYSSNRFI